MKNIFTYTAFRTYLAALLDERTVSHPRYSLRVFARDLGVSPSRLSEVLSSRCGISTASALKIAQNLDLKPTEQKFFLDLVQCEYGKTDQAKSEAKARVEEHRQRRGFVHDESQSLLSKWYYSPLVELLTLSSPLSKTEICKVLAISDADLSQAVDFLVKEGYVVKLPSGEWEKSHVFLKYESRVPSQTIRDAHKAVLHKASEAIETQAIADRKYLSAFMSVRKDTIENARNDLEEFTQRFVKTYSSEKAADSVYCFALQLFRIGSAPK